VDAENEALALRDWRLLRPRVDEAGRALSAVLAGAPRQEPPRKWGAGGSHRPGKGYYLMPCGEARRRSRQPVFHNSRRRGVPLQEAPVLLTYDHGRRLLQGWQPAG
jgi:hypothetical protein